MIRQNPNQPENCDNILYNVSVQPVNMPAQIINEEP